MIETTFTFPFVRVTALEISPIWLFNAGQGPEQVEKKKPATQISPCRSLRLRDCPSLSTKRKSGTWDRIGRLRKSFRSAEIQISLIPMAMTRANPATSRPQTTTVSFLFAGRGPGNSGAGAVTNVG